jgi:hypothetical protein
VLRSESLMKNTAIALLIFFGAKSVGVVYPLAQQTASVVQIYGYVTTLRGSPISGASVEFTNGSNKTVVDTKHAGFYSIDLLPGRYLITITGKGVCSQYFERQFDTGEAKISSDFALVDCSDCDMTNVDLEPPPLEPDSAARPLPVLDASKFQYKSERLVDTGLEAPVPEIRYGYRREEADLVVYRPLTCPKPPFDKPVILVYGSLILSANTLTYSKKNHTVIAEGAVVIVDKEGIRKASKTELSPAKDKFRISHIN